MYVFVSCALSPFPMFFPYIFLRLPGVLHVSKNFANFIMVICSTQNVATLLHTHTHTHANAAEHFARGFSRLAKSKLLPLILFAPKFGFPCLLFFFFWVSGFFFFFVGFFHGAVGPAGAFPFRHLQARTSGKMINYFVYLPFGNHFRSERGTNLYRWPIDGWQNEGAALAIIVF